MDRSYPYSRRVVSRARLRKRMAAVTGFGIAAATLGFMLAWSPDPIAATLVPPPLQALVTDALAVGQPAPPGIRRIYPYSIVPGGVSGAAELARVVRTDRVVAEHYASFDVAKARAVTVAQPRAVHVSYRKGGKVYWTARKVMLAPGETLLTDGRSEVRARCANRISDVPQYPVEAHQPAMDELDNPVEVEEGAPIALGADGLPVSSADIDGVPRDTGQAGRIVLGGAGGAGGAGGTASAAPAGAGPAGSAPGTGTGLATLGHSGTSSGLVNRPVTADRPAPSTGGGSGATGGSPGTSSGSGGSGGASPGAQPPAGGSLTLPSAPTVQAPVPEAGASPLPALPSAPALPAQPQPGSEAPLPAAPLPRPDAPTIPGTPLPSTPLPSTPLPSTPLPSTPLPSTPLPAPLPVSQPTGGDTGAPQPGTPGTGALPPLPGVDTPLPVSPLPQPAPWPLPDGTGLPPVPQPASPTAPGGTELPAWTPTTPSLPPLPGMPPAAGPETAPFIPRPDQQPPLQTVVEPGDSPADVPEPGSLWLAAIALAALSVLRRRA